MASLAVANAFPLILLSRAGRLELMRLVSPEIVVPIPVADEILARGENDLTARALTGSSWIRTVPVPEIPESIREWGLGAGESAVLAVAHERIGTEVIVDDFMARKCAVWLDIPVRGTLGIVLTAKRRGLVPSARVVMEDLISAGLYLSRSVLDEALRRVGE